MGDQARILDYIDSCQDEAVDFLRRMVQIDSSTLHHGFGGQEKAVQDWLAGQFRSWGLETRLFEPDNAKLERYPDAARGHDYHDRPNLIGIWKGMGSGRSLILNGHVDTMPAGDVKKWTHDPWGAEIVDSVMYGLGACDMKGGVAAMIMATRLLQEAGVRLRGDVIIESVVDEEGGGNGTLACVIEGYRADAAIVTEPTWLHVQPATKGVFLLEVLVEGYATHACLKWGGVNAIEKGMKIVQGMIELERLWLARRHHPLFPPPTITIGKIDGGLAGSAVPGECSLKFHIEYLPTEIDAYGHTAHPDGESIKAEVASWIELLCAGDEWLCDHPPRLDWYQYCIPHYLDPSHALVGVMSGAARQVSDKAIVSGFPAACDARHLQNIGGVPTVVFGPGDIQFAHSVDERISVDEYVNAVKILALSIYDWCA